MPRPTRGIGAKVCHAACRVRRETMGRMPVVTRLLTFVDVDYEDYSLGEPVSRETGWTAIRSRRRRPGARVSVTARHEAVLADGRRVVLLNDRGWGVGTWATETAEEMERTARFTVGPDEPPEGRTQADMDTLHWDELARVLQQQGVEVEATELKVLPHDVELSDRVLARVGRGPRRRGLREE